MAEKLTAQTRDTVLEAAIKIIRENYAFADVVEKMVAKIRRKMEKGGYAGIVSKEELCHTLSQDLREVCKDLHLLVYYNLEAASDIKRREETEAYDKDDPEHWWTGRSDANFGFKRVEYLEGNVGYLDLRVFAPVSLGGETAVAAMNFLANCDALIFDLRNCAGGDPFLVQLVESYLFGGEPKHLLSLHDRPNDKHQQIWTLPHVPGRRLPHIPVYILTSKRTFSGGEDFAYTLKHHGRATIVGETTGGGAHTIDFMVIHEGFIISLPTGYPVHPVTGGNWEGVGVEPHIPVSEEEALKTAHLHAFENLIEQTENSERRRSLAWGLGRIRAKYTPLHVDEQILSRYAGQYRNYNVELKNGVLFMKGDDPRDDWKMTPLTEALFAVDDEYNARFVIEGDDKASAFVFIHRDSGREINCPRT
jgi:hypothetical protein